MKLKLKIASGPLQGREYPLYSGITIGRSSSDININDPKISGRHAKIENSPSGDLVVVDLGSSNGIRVENKKLIQVSLTPGLIIQLGSTYCEIVQDPASREANMPHAVDSDLTAAAAPPPVPLESAVWSDYFPQFITKSLSNIKNKHHEMKPLKPLIILKITHGLQAGTEWTVGYGPRAFGLGSLDFPLFEPGLPPIVFKIMPNAFHAVFETDHSDKVRLNGRQVSSERLRPDDEIVILNTRIKVSFES